MYHRVKYISIHLTIVFLAIAIQTSCRGGESSGQEMRQRKVLVEIGDSALYIDEVLGRIPSGIAPADSAAMFAGIVDSWIENLLLTDVAAESSIDMERIERLTADYRKQLIMSEYRKLGKQDGIKRVTEDKIREYYSVYGEEMILEQPLIKGIYLKVNDKASNIDGFKRMVSHPTKTNIDRLEKDVIADALQYEYFMDKWVAWESISSQIPYRFFDADAFVESTQDFTTSYNGATYILHISEYLPSGEKMPFDFAREEIRRILTREENTASEQRVLQTLYKRAIKEGKLKMVCYDVLRHELRP